MGFFDLAKGTLPLIITMLVYFSTIGYDLQKKVFNFENRDTGLRDRSTGIHMDKAMICGIIFLCCIAGFVFHIFTLGTVAVLAACACIVTGCISLDKAAATMDWTSILVLGGSMGFSKGLDQSGVLGKIADVIIRVLGPAATPFAVFSVFLILASVMGNVMSHTATTAILVPIAIAVAQGLDCNPTLYAIAVVIGCNLAFATPVSTPPLTMTLPVGYRFGDYVAVGGVLNILCVIVALITLPLLYGI
jgi:di/tricarboxylate transporter